MISEHTAAANLLAELAGHFTAADFHSFILEPGLVKKGAAPYDPAVLLRGKGMVLQFKAPQPTATGYKYKLNGDSPLRDQHLRLLHLERSGCAVYYALPMFHMTPQLVSGHGWLRLMTAWFRPTQLMPEDGPIGRFEVECDTGKNVWHVKRKVAKFIESPMSFPELEEDFSRRGSRHTLEMLLNKLNDIAMHGIAPEGNSYVIGANMQLKAVPPSGRAFLEGQAVLGLVPEEKQEQKSLVTGRQPQRKAAYHKGPQQ
ncbi:MAG TPA: hypothetical protein PLL10_10775 [Elusimicrobiales bacterium]|nr:hypothetical protein [Elusimicrobiales bacterium]